MLAPGCSGQLHGPATFPPPLFQHLHMPTLKPPHRGRCHSCSSARLLVLPQQKRCSLISTDAGSLAASLKIVLNILPCIIIITDFIFFSFFFKLNLYLPMTYLGPYPSNILGFFLWVFVQKFFWTFAEMKKNIFTNIWLCGRWYHFNSTFTKHLRCARHHTFVKIMANIYWMFTLCQTLF